MKFQLRYLMPLFLSLCFYTASSQDKSSIEKWKVESIQDIQSQYPFYKDIALQIWNYAELGYKEVKSSALLQKTLNDNGFDVKAGVAGIPTAFVATYGSGKPAIGILAEYDALPGLSQEVTPERKSIENKNA